MLKFLPKKKVPRFVEIGARIRCLTVFSKYVRDDHINIMTGTSASVLERHSAIQKFFWLFSFYIICCWWFFFRIHRYHQAVKSFIEFIYNRTSLYSKFQPILLLQTHKYIYNDLTSKFITFVTGFSSFTRHDLFTIIFFSLFPDMMLLTLALILFSCLFTVNS